MSLDLITVTQDNFQSAIQENLWRIYVDITYKVPLSGANVALLGDWNFQGLYQLRGAASAGPRSAYADAPGVAP